ncbi:MAG: amidohydrolase family protein [Akkermansiaceae bacterium]
MALFTQRGGFLAILLGVCLVAATQPDGDKSSAASEKPEEKMHVYLLIGGKAMTGLVEISDEEAKVLDRCFLLNDKGEWVPASEPLNRFSSIRKEGENLSLGFGLGFAEKMLAADPDITIGLVVNAGEGPKIEDWKLKNQAFREARRRTLKQALRTGDLKGVLWHHDSSHSISVLDEMKDLAAELRSSFGIWSLPFIAGEVAGNPSMNSQLAAFSDEVHATGLASVTGLAEEAKFGAATVRAYGERYAEEMLRVQRELDEQEAIRPKRKPQFFDTHVHAMSAKPGGLDPVARWMQKMNVERCIVSPIGQSIARTKEQRETMLANFRKYEGKILRFCVIEPDDVQTVEEAVEILEMEKAAGAIGFGEHYGRDLMFDDPKNMRLYAACEKVGLPVMFHIDQNKNMDESGLPRVERVLREFPDLILIAHAYWWLYLPEGTCDRLLQKYPNLYADVSGLRIAGVLNRDRGYTREFMIRNADRILFGSDAGWWSFQGSEAQFTLFEEFGLPEEVLEKFYRGNAERLFGLVERRGE